MKVCIQYCHGLCNPATTAARIACYVVAEQTLGAKLCDLGCGPALEAGVCTARASMRICAPTRSSAAMASTPTRSTTSPSTSITLPS
jgi:hypothetical protein